MKQQQVEEFYTAQVEKRLKMFVKGNERVDRAWETLIDNISQSPKNVLEVGCSIGVICWRMGLTWPNAQITGLDLTKVYVEIGNKLFRSSNLKLVHGTLPYPFSTRFDLIVLMDVYEHISLEDRDTFNKTLKENLTEDGVVFLSFPTVRYQQYLREHAPDELQPVDEDVPITAIAELTSLLQKDVQLYKENSVYHTGDYAHVVIASHGVCKRLPQNKSVRNPLNLVTDWRRPVWTKKRYRKSLVDARLSADK